MFLSRLVITRDTRPWHSDRKDNDPVLWWEYMVFRPINISFECIFSFVIQPPCFISSVPWVRLFFHKLLTSQIKSVHRDESSNKKRSWKSDSIAGTQEKYLSRYITLTRVLHRYPMTWFDLFYINRISEDWISWEWNNSSQISVPKKTRLLDLWIFNKYKI